MPKNVVEELKEYYRARAVEYDDWYFRRGTYDKGAAHTEEWNREACQIENCLRQSKPGGDILEIACGTGLWTRHLALLADHLTALDASPEVITINLDRVTSANVEYQIVDIFDWRAGNKYDFIFFGFWLSHVPDAKFDGFWAMVEDALAPGGQVFFVDSLISSGLSETEIQKIEAQSPVAELKVSDGRRFSIIKIFYQPAILEARLQELGWRGYVRGSEKIFLYGCLKRK